MLSLFFVCVYLQSLTLGFVALVRGNLGTFVVLSPMATVASVTTLMTDGPPAAMVSGDAALTMLLMIFSLPAMIWAEQRQCEDAAIVSAGVLSASFLVFVQAAPLAYCPAICLAVAMTVYAAHVMKADDPLAPFAPDEVKP